MNKQHIVIAESLEFPEKFEEYAKIFEPFDFSGDLKFIWAAMLAVHDNYHIATEKLYHYFPYEERADLIIKCLSLQNKARYNDMKENKE